VEETLPPNLEITLDLFGQLHHGAGHPTVWDLLLQYGSDPHHSALRHIFAGEWQVISVQGYARAIARWQQFRRDMLAFMKNYDAIICPPNAYDALPHDTLRDHYPGFTYTMTHNLSGMPGVVVRGGTSENKLPIGVQVVARYWREDVALAIAQHLETELGGWQPPNL
jgi:amidase